MISEMRNFTLEAWYRMFQYQSDFEKDNKSPFLEVYSKKYFLFKSFTSR